MINFINIQCTKHEPLKKLNGLKGDSKMNSVSVFSMGDDLEIKETEQFFIDLKNQLPPPTISIFLTIKRDKPEEFLFYDLKKNFLSKPKIIIRGFKRDFLINWELIKIRCREFNIFKDFFRDLESIIHGCELCKQK